MEKAQVSPTRDPGKITCPGNYQWKVHNLPEVNIMEKQVKYRIGYTEPLELPGEGYGKYHGELLVAAPEVIPWSYPGTDAERSKGWKNYWLC